MTLIRPRQRVVTGINPHNANHRALIPNRTRTPPPAASDDFRLRAMDADWDFERSSGASDISYKKVISQVAIDVPAYYAEKGLFMESERENIALYSEDFTNVFWTTTLAGTDVTPNAIAAPDGSVTADKLIGLADPDPEFHALAQVTVFPVSGDAVFSIFAKAGEYNKIVLVASSFNAKFNLDTGLIENETVPHIAYIEKYTDGWYRCILRTDDADGLIFAALVNELDELVYIGDGTSGLYVWGAQIEADTFSTSYIPTDIITVTRSAPTLTRLTSSLSGFTGDNFTFRFVIRSERRYDNAAGDALIFAIRTDDQHTIEVMMDSSTDQIAFRRNHDPFFVEISSTLDALQFDVDTQIEIVIQQSTEKGMVLMINGVEYWDVSADAKEAWSVAIPTVTEIGVFNGELALFEYWDSALSRLPSGGY